MKIYRKLNKSSSGFTLIELLLATSLTIVVITIAGAGLVSIMQANQKAEAGTLRRINLTRAADFIADEVRTAVRVNNTSTTNAVNSTADTAATASNTDSPFSPALPTLSRGEARVLYLEIPLTTTTCSGIPGPPIDKVVYDIKTTSSPWLGPRKITRYGREFNSDGTIDPCSRPQESNMLVDSIKSTITTTPTCTSPAVLSGAGGFYACVNGSQVDLYLAGDLASTTSNNAFIANKSYSINTTTRSRVCRIVPNLVGQQLPTAKSNWIQAGFSGKFSSETLTETPTTTTPVATQSLIASSCQPSTSSITITP